MDLIVGTIKSYLTFQAPTPQNGQTYSKNLPAFANELLNVFDHFVGLVLKGLMETNKGGYIYQLRKKYTKLQCAMFSNPSDIFTG